MRAKDKRKKKNAFSNEYFQALIENAHDGIVVYDQSGIVKFASASVKKLLGFKPLEIVGQSVSNSVHPEDAKLTHRTFNSLLRKPREKVTLIQRLKHKNGSFIWAEAVLKNFNDIPEIGGVVSNFRDITERKLAQDKTIETHLLQESINQNLSEGVFIGELNSKFLYANEAFLKLTGYKSLPQILKLKLSDLYVDQKQHLQIVKALKTSLSLKDREMLFRRKNGQTFLGLMNVTLLKNLGHADYLVGSICDITDEKSAELEKIESKNFLDNIINTVAAPIFVKDERRRWVLVNQQFCELIGHPREELIGKSDINFWPAHQAKVFIKVDKELLRTSKTIVNEEKVTSPDGTMHDLLTVKSLYTNEAGKKFIIGFITEITDIKKAEEKIKQLHANFKAVMESSKESIFSVDQKLNYTAFNQHHQKVMKSIYGVEIELGASKMQYLRKSKEASWVKAELKKGLNGKQFVTEHQLDYPEYQGAIQTTYNPIIDEGGNVKGVAVFVQDITQRKHYESIIRSINSNLRAVMESTEDRILAVDRDYRYITFNRSHAKSMRKEFGKTIAHGDPLLESLPKEIAEITKQENDKAFSGKRFKSQLELPNKTIIETSYNPIHNEKGKVTGSALFVRDVTKSKRIGDKLKLLNEALTKQNLQLAAQENELKSTLHELSERNFELDQLMYKTSHDLRAPLCSVLGLLNLANLDSDQNNQRLYLEKIKDRINKLDDFISSMLNYARVNRVELEMSPVDLATVVNSAIKELEYLENFKKLKIDLLSTGSVIFNTDKLRINIIFSNIISNAYKYYNPTKKSFLKIKITMNAGGVSIKFSDNGIGIKTEHMNKIFNMFYRATDRSQGSGLGMYIVKQAVEKLDGTISIRSEYGVGTDIKIFLPQTKINFLK